MPGVHCSCNCYFPSALQIILIYYWGRSVYCPCHLFFFVCLFFVVILELMGRLYGDCQPWLKFQLVRPNWNFISTVQLHVYKNVNSVFWVEISTRSSQPELWFKPWMEIPNFQYNRHFFQPGIKIWYHARVNS